MAHEGPYPPCLPWRPCRRGAAPGVRRVAQAGEEAEDGGAHGAGGTRPAAQVAEAAEVRRSEGSSQRAERWRGRPPLAGRPVAERQVPSLPSSSHIGVTWSKANRLWLVQIHHNSKTQHVGCFEDEHEAARAFDEAARRLRGAAAEFTEEEVDDLELLIIVE